MISILLNEVGNTTDCFEGSRPKDENSLCFIENNRPFRSEILKFFYPFCDKFKILSCTYYLKEAEMKITAFVHFKEYHGNHKNFTSLYDIGKRCLKIRDVCMDFEPYFKVHNLVSVHPKTRKASYLVK